MKTIKELSKGFKESYSQNGEDKIIYYLFTRLLDPGTKTCMEFGAADGFFCSNTASLWIDNDWNAILVESDPTLFRKLKQNVGPRETVFIAQDEVENPDDYYDEPLDFISIDVDGHDYHIWKRCQTRHRVVCIEYNPTFPPHVWYVGGQWQGASFRSIVDLGSSKGYTFLTATKTNIFFVRDEEAHSISKIDTTLENNFDWSGVSYIVSDYRGNFDIVGSPPYSMVHKTILGMSW